MNLAYTVPLMSFLTVAGSVAFIFACVAIAGGFELHDDEKWGG